MSNKHNFNRAVYGISSRCTILICANCGISDGYYAYSHIECEAPRPQDSSGSAGLALLADKESGECQELNKGHYHEIIDRGHLVMGMIDDYLIDHPGMTKEMNQLCEEAQSKLYRVTNLACGEEDRNFGG